MRFLTETALRLFGELLRQWSKANDYGDKGEAYAKGAHHEPPTGKMTRQQFVDALASADPCLVEGRDYVLDPGLATVNVVYYETDTLHVNIPAYGRMEPDPGSDGVSFNIPRFYDECAARRKADGRVHFSSCETKAAQAFLDMRIADYSIAQCA
ncbi:MAG: hypothetical protein R3C97_07100 [Geminicoccaceae bacterium]